MDLAIDETVVPGSNIHTNLTIDGIVWSTYKDFIGGVGAQVVVEVRCLVVYEGVFECSTDSAKCCAETNIITPKDVLDASIVKSSLDSYNCAYGSSSPFIGGDFNDFLNVIKQGSKFAWDIGTKQVLPVIKDLKSIVGLGAKKTREPSKKRLASMIEGAQMLNTMGLVKWMVVETLAKINSEIKIY